MSYVDLAILSNVPKIIWIKRSYYYDKIIIFIMMIGMIRDIVEKSSFGVCSSIARKMGISSSRVRLYFIYTSFITMGSPLIIYLVVAFWLNLRTYLRKGYHILID